MRFWKQGLNIDACLACQLLTSLRIVEERLNNLGQSLRVICLNQARVVPIDQVLGDTPNAAGDDGQGRGHGLDQHSGKAFSVAAGIRPRGQDQEIRCGKYFAQLGRGQRPQKSQPSTQAKALRLGLQRRQIRTGSDDITTCFCFHFRQSPEQNRDPFAGDQATNKEYNFCLSRCAPKTGQGPIARQQDRCKSRRW